MTEPKRRRSPFERQFQLIDAEQHNSMVDNRSDSHGTRQLTEQEAVKRLLATALQKAKVAAREKQKARLRRKVELEKTIHEKLGPRTSTSLWGPLRDVEIMGTPEGDELSQLNREDELAESDYINSLPAWKRWMFVYPNRAINAGFIPAGGGTLGLASARTPLLTVGSFGTLPSVSSPRLMETINNFWELLGKSKIRLEGNGRYSPGILTKPGTSPTTFNGLNIKYVTSPKGGNVTHKFYTDLGSEYILTSDGFARRIKSPHANTSGRDVGLHEWNKGATRFLDSDELGWSYQAWTDLNKPLGFSEKDGIISLVTKDNGKWRYVMRSELRPNAVKNGTIKDGIILSAYTTEPKVGKWMLEYGTNPTGEINWFHPGSQVAFIEGLKQGGKMNALFLKNGSGIKIKKKNRGKFTDYCGGTVTQSCINNAKASGNPTLKKRAIFAENARKWHKRGVSKHLEGGLITSSYLILELPVKKVYLPDATDVELSSPLDFFDWFDEESTEDSSGTKDSKIALPNFEEAPSVTTETSDEAKETSTGTKETSTGAKEGDDKKTISLILTEEGIEHTLVSDYRTRVYTYSGRRSNHNKRDENGHAMAQDIVPKDGDFDRFRKEIYSNPRVVAWLRNKRWGILEELYKLGSATGYIDPKDNSFNLTGVNVGKHFHFGPDSPGVRTSSKYMSYD